MLKEIIISIYLLFIKFLFGLFIFFPQKKKITFLVTFEENLLYLYRELEKGISTSKMVIFCKPTLFHDLKKELPQANIIPMGNINFISTLRCLYHLATTKSVVIDNYYALFSAIKLRKNVECIQIWHAAGAFKTFGLTDIAASKRNATAQKRFRKVYESFDKVVVGSNEMASIFKEAFGITEEKILRTGVPRTDFFYDEIHMERVRSSLYKRYPILREKKVILYAPTFRDGELDEFKINLDLQQLKDKLGDDFILLLKLHPAVTSQKEHSFPHFVIDLSDYPRVNDLLIVTDYLITDYSSIPFEFGLLNKPMIFFTYDLETYKKNRGLIGNYEEEIPGSIANNTNEVIEMIVDHQFDLDKINDFSLRWNQYSVGDSSKKLTQYILSRMM